MSQTKAQLVSGTTAQDLTVDNINTTSINSGQTSGRKNLIINGAMQVAQRGTSGTNSGYGSVDRFRVQHSGTDEAPTQAQVDVASGTTPYTLGFRKALRITNGNQTSGAGTSDSVHFQYYAEAQDIANSGWNYLSSSSFVTLSFWIKSSVAQNFQGRVRTRQGTSQNYAFETGSLSADTWTKITKTIPGNSNLQFDNDTAKNFQTDIFAFLGTDDTSSAVSLDTWATYASGTQVKDVTSTWYTTDNATLEITGVQLEVGSTATDFEHRTFGEELALCQRYYTKLTGGGGNELHFNGSTKQQQYVSCSRVELPTTMRAAPSISFTGTRDVLFYSNDNSGFSGDVIDVNSFNVRWGSSVTIGDGTAYTAVLKDNPNFVECSAEL